MAVTKGPKEKKVGVQRNWLSCHDILKTGGRDQSRRIGHRVLGKVATGKILLESSMSSACTQFPTIRSIFAKVPFSFFFFLFCHLEVKQERKMSLNNVCSWRSQCWLSQGLWDLGSETEEVTCGA